MLKEDLDFPCYSRACGSSDFFGNFKVDSPSIFLAAPCRGLGVLFEKRREFLGRHSMAAPMMLIALGARAPNRRGLRQPVSSGAAPLRSMSRTSRDVGMISVRRRGICRRPPPGPALWSNKPLSRYGPSSFTQAHTQCCRIMRQLQSPSFS